MTGLNVARGHQAMSVLAVFASQVPCADCQGEGRVAYALAGYRPSVEECDGCKPCEGACGKRVALSEGVTFCAVCWAAGED